MFLEFGSDNLSGGGVFAIHVAILGKGRTTHLLMTLEAGGVTRWIIMTYRACRIRINNSLDGLSWDALGWRIVGKFWKVGAISRGWS